MDAQLSLASVEEKPLLARLVQLYLHDLSEYLADVRPDESGQFGYDWFDHYWYEPERSPYVIRASGEVAGFALVRSEQGENSMAEFFILRSHRRAGIGTSAALGLLRLHPGKWAVHFARTNERAVPFWGHVCSEAADPGTLVLSDAGGGDSAYQFTVS